MHVVYPRCCGMDVHKKNVAACVLLTQDDRREQRLVRTFSTMTADLLACLDGLESLQVENAQGSDG